MHIPFVLTFLSLHLVMISKKIRPLAIKFNLYQRLEKYLMKSRKLTLLTWVIILATVGTFIPPLVCWILALFKYHIQSFMILTDGDWITVISITIPAYMGALTWEKHIALSNGIQPKDLDQTVMAIKGIALKDNNDDDNSARGNNDSDNKAVGNNK